MVPQLQISATELFIQFLQEILQNLLWSYKTPYITGCLVTNWYKGPLGNITCSQSGACLHGLRIHLSAKQCNVTFLSFPITFSIATTALVIRSLAQSSFLALDHILSLSASTHSLGHKSKSFHSKERHRKLSKYNCKKSFYCKFY